MSAVTTLLVTLSERAHQTSTEKGFYEPGYDSSIHATKIALIQTEIKEVHDEALDLKSMTEERKQKLADEIADVAIRTLDFIAYIKGELYLQNMVMYRSKTTVINWAILQMYGLCADMVQLDRKTLNDAERDMGLARLSCQMIQACYNLAEAFDIDLTANILGKMEFNTGRPKHHNRRY